MKVVIDRFEDIYAVCEKEDGSMINIEKDKIGVEAKEGDILIISNNGIIKDEVATKNRKEEIEKMTNDLWQ